MRARTGVLTDEIGVGNIVSLTDANGGNITFTILGPFDANPEKNILSTQSQIALNLIGKSIGDSVTVKNEEYKISSIGSFLQK